MSQKYDDNGRLIKPEVGYKKPPKETQFKKGTSGNPKGRPKKSEEIKTFAEYFIGVAYEEVITSENGKKKKMTKLDALARSLFNKALNSKTATENKAIIDFMTKIITPTQERLRERQRAEERYQIEKSSTPEEAAKAYFSLIKSINAEMRDEK